ncbi:MAG: Ig-like domain-containing protein [Legionella sp.]|nr:Ig-like domain-containing protein [Legionella sp.]
MKVFSLSIKFSTAFFALCCFVLISLFVYAGTEAKFALDPLTPTSFELKPAEEANVQYQVTNNTKLLRTLTMVPISGITQDTSAGFCSSPFTLAPNDSCILNLDIAAGKMSSPVLGGPKICKTMGPNDNRPTPFLCSQPSYVNSLNVKVVSAETGLVAIQIDPLNSTVPAGGTLQFTATGIYADGSKTNITSLVNWATGAEDIAIISNSPGSQGLAFGVSHTGGITVISATLGNVVASTQLIVNAATLENITLAPTNATIGQWTNQQFTALGSYSDGTTQNLTSLVTWSSSNENFVIISNSSGTNGLASGVAPGTATITASFNGQTVTTDLTVSAAQLTGIDVFPTTDRIAATTTLAFKATGYYADNRTQDLTTSVLWGSSNTSIATISNVPGTQGLATAIAAGPPSTLITATFGTEVGSAILNVTNATLVSIEIAPLSAQIAQGTTKQYTATGHFSDGTTQDITTLVTWTAVGTATISNSYSTAGLATGKTPAGGPATITAAFNGIQSTTPATLDVTNATLSQFTIDLQNKIIAATTTIQFRAIGTFSDGTLQDLTRQTYLADTTQDLTSQTLWGSTNPTVATISNEAPTQGLATSTAFGGDTTITANYSGFSSSTNLHVTTASLVSIEIAPSNSSMDAETYLPFIATGHFSDGTEQDITGIVTWTSTNQNVATISNAVGSQGLALGLGQDGSTITTTIRATYNGVTGQTQLTVNPVLIALEITADPSSIALGQEIQLVATGTMTDGTRPNLSNQVTWSSDPTQIVTISSTGLLKGIAEGDTNIGASLGTVVATAQPMHVGPAELVSIALEPPSVSVVAGRTVTVNVRGTYTDGTTPLLTSGVTWTTGDAAIATVTGTGTGTIRGVAHNGDNTTMTASVSGVSPATGQVEVTAAVLESIVLEPPAVTVVAGLSTTVAVRGTYSDQESELLTSGVTWSTDDPLIATATGSGTGTITGVARNGDTTTMRANVTGVAEASGQVEVTAARLISIELVPPSVRVVAGLTTTVNVRGTYTDGQRLITSGVTWTTDDSDIATVTGTGTGTITGVVRNGGTTTMRANVTGVSEASGQVDVTPAELISIALEPSSVTVVAGLTETVNVRGTYTDGQRLVTSGVTWTTDDSDIATVTGTGTGTITGVVRNGGTTTMRANVTGVSEASGQVDVTPAELISIALDPSSVTVIAGLTETVVVRGTYTDGQRPVTSGVAWTTGDPTIATVTGTGDGIIKGVAHNGDTTTMTATVTGVTPASGQVFVTPARLTSIALEPPSVTVVAGLTETVNVRGTYTDDEKPLLTSGVTWTTGDSDIATVTGTGSGIIKGVAHNGDTTTMTATVAGVTPASGQVLVTPARLTSIALEPPSVVVTAGLTETVNVRGTYTDDERPLLTSGVTWTTGDPTIATVTGTGSGIIKGVAHNGNTTTMTASVNIIGVADATGSVQVDPARLTTITVTPDPIENLPRGRTQQMAAEGTYTDNIKENLTNTVTWATEDTDIAQISNMSGSYGIVIAAASSGETDITATIGTVVGRATITVAPPVLDRIDITPAVSGLPKGDTRNLTATGVYSDLTTADLTSTSEWRSLDPMVASVSNIFGLKGLLTAVASTGSTDIIATFGAVEGSLTVSVGPAVVKQIDIYPTMISVVAGKSTSLLAEATYTDNTKVDLTNSVSWGTNDQNVAVVSNDVGTQGILTGVKHDGGGTKVTATLGDIVGERDVTVTPAELVNITILPSSSASVAAGTTTPLKAEGLYTDQTELDITNSVTWSTGSSAIATISSSGVLYGVSQNTTTMKAKLGTIETNGIVDVTAPLLLEITVIPDNTSLAAGRTTQLQAQGKYTDGSMPYITNVVSWTTGDDNLITISNADGSQGLLTAKAVGTDIRTTATLGTVVGNGKVTVTPAELTQIDIMPAAAATSPGATVPLMAQGTYTDNSKLDLTTSVFWETGDQTIATISNASGSQGVVTGVNANPNPTTTKATLGAIVGNGTVSVTNATLTSIAIVPGPPDTPVSSVAKGNTLQLTARGTYSDSSVRDISSLVTWLPSSTSFLNINTVGLVTGTNIGSGTTVNAKLGSVEVATVNQPTINVTAPVLKSIKIIPSSVTNLAVGDNTQLQAEGTYSDQSTAYITTSVTWSTGNTNIARISNTSGTQGVLTATGVDPTPNTSMAATLGSISGTGTVGTVPPRLVSIAITPTTTPLTVNSGASLNALTATGRYSDGSTANLTNTVTWNSSVANGVSITNGVITGGSVIGPTNVTASLGSITGTPTIVVNVLATVTIAINNPTRFSLAGIIVTNNAQSTNLTAGQTSYKYPAGIAKGGTYSVAVRNSSVRDGLYCGAVSGSGNVVSSNIIVNVNCVVNNLYVAIVGDTDGQQVFVRGLETSSGDLSAGIFSDSRNSIFPTAGAFTADGTYLYLTGGSSTVRRVNSCPVKLSNGELTDTCEGLAGNLPTGNTFPSAIADYVTTGGLEYMMVGSYDGDKVFRCGPITGNGSLGTCTANSMTINNPRFMVINPAKTAAYITSYSNDAVYYCTINQSTGLFNSCRLMQNYSFTSPRGIAINPAGTILYVTANTTVGRIWYCKITGNDLTDCNTTGTTADTYGGLVINRAGTYLYASNQDTAGGVRWFSIDQSTGALTYTTGNSTGFNNPIGLVIP